MNGSTFLKDASTKMAVDAESRRKPVSFHVFFYFLDIRTCMCVHIVSLVEEPVFVRRNVLIRYSYAFKGGDESTSLTKCPQNCQISVWESKSVNSCRVIVTRKAEIRIFFLRHLANIGSTPLLL